jgi:hypothetical protein
MLIEFLDGTERNVEILKNAKLEGANLDYSCLPLWCGGLNFKAGKKMWVQILYHLCSLKIDDPEILEIRKSLLPIANQMHRTEVERLV